MENEIIVLNLCEANFLFLKPDILYKFEVNPTCADCKELAEKSKPHVIEGED